MKYQPTEKPSTDVAQEIISTVGPIGIYFEKGSTNTVTTMEVIGKYFNCSMGKDYARVLHSVYSVCEKIPRNPKTGRPYSRTHNTLPDHVSEDGQKAMRSVQSFYHAVCYLLGERSPKKQKKTIKVVELLAGLDEVQALTQHSSSPEDAFIQVRDLIVRLAV